MWAWQCESGCAPKISHALRAMTSTWNPPSRISGSATGHLSFPCKLNLLDLSSSFMYFYVVRVHGLLVHAYRGYQWELLSIMYKGNSASQAMIDIEKYSRIYFVKNVIENSTEQKLSLQYLHCVRGVLPSRRHRLTVSLS